MARETSLLQRARNDGGSNSELSLVLYPSHVGVRVNHVLFWGSCESGEDVKKSVYLFPRVWSHGIPFCDYGLGP